MTTEKHADGILMDPNKRPSRARYFGSEMKRVKFRLTTDEPVLATRLLHALPHGAHDGRQVNGAVAAGGLAGRHGPIFRDVERRG